jgi:hypothetical protein
MRGCGKEKTREEAQMPSVYGGAPQASLSFPSYFYIHQRFPAFLAAFEKRFAPSFGRFRLPLISHTASTVTTSGTTCSNIRKVLQLPNG